MYLNNIFKTLKMLRFSSIVPIFTDRKVNIVGTFGCQRQKIEKKN